MAIGYVVGGKYESKICANSKLNKRCFILSTALGVNLVFRISVRYKLLNNCYL